MAQWRGVALAGVILAAGPARAAPLQIEVAGAGEVFTRDVGEPKLLPGNLAPVSGVTSPVMIHPGHRIEGSYCHGFGFSFRPINLPPGRQVPIVVRVTHPLWTLPDGRSGTQESWDSVIDSPKWSYVGYSFDEAWSLVPGTWIFTVTTADGRLLTEQSFQVDVAPDQTLPKEGCTQEVS
jgi:hypothetical protein